MRQKILVLMQISIVTMCAALGMSGVSFAQTITGSITGVVTDTTGAVVPGAKVSVTNVNTGVTVIDVANGAGIYSLRFLQIGRYKVDTDAPGSASRATALFRLRSTRLQR